MTAFKIGQIVKARRPVQGLVEGSAYQIIGISEMPTPFGNFVTYQVKGITQLGVTLEIRNGHLVLDAASASFFPLIAGTEADAIIVNEDGTWAEWFLADRRGLAEILTDFGFDRCLDGNDAGQTLLLNPKEYSGPRIDLLRSDMETVAGPIFAQQRGVSFMG